MIKKISTLTAVTLVATATLFAGTASAATILAEYSFDSSSTASSDGDAQTTASAITIGVGSIATSTGLETTPTMPDPPLVKIAGNDTQNSMSGAISGGEWLTFSIDTNGTEVDFEELSVLIGGEDLYKNHFGNVYTSAQVGDTLESGEANSELDFVGFKGMVSNDTDVAPETQTVDFSSITGFNGTLTVWIPFMDDSGSSARWLEVDDITVTGTVIPEPASLALLALAGAALLRRRRR